MRSRFGTDARLEKFKQQFELLSKVKELYKDAHLLLGTIDFQIQDILRQIQDFRKESRRESLRQTAGAISLHRDKVMTRIGMLEDKRQKFSAQEKEAIDRARPKSRQ